MIMLLKIEGCLRGEGGERRVNNNKLNCGNKQLLFTRSQLLVYNYKI